MKLYCKKNTDEIKDKFGIHFYIILNNKINCNCSPLF